MLRENSRNCLQWVCTDLYSRYNALPRHKLTTILAMLADDKHEDITQCFQPVFGFIDVRPLPH